MKPVDKKNQLNQIPIHRGGPVAVVNDVVLLYLEDTPVSFARVEKILPDSKKDWYQIKLLMLQIPMQSVTWILKDDYINGHEFNMNGKRMRLEKIEPPKEDLPISAGTNDILPGPQTAPEKEPESNSGGKIISFFDLKKKEP
jgi:hypothetical protein